MFINYFKVIFRNLMKNRFFSFINIFGLAVGMASAIIIALLVMDELSYENFHDNSDRISRVVIDTYIGSAAAFGPVIQSQVPEVVDFVRIDHFTATDKKLFSYGEKRFYESRFILADPSLFTIFTFPFSKGDPRTALSSPDSIVLTETTARKYFKDQNPLGKILTLENRWNFYVTGIIKDVPANSHLKFDLLAPFAFNKKKEHYGAKLDENWGQLNFITYLLSAKKVNVPVLQDKVNRAYRDAGAYEKVGVDFFIQPLKEIHLKSNLASELEANSSTGRVLFYLAIGLMILLIACINSMNLSTARSMNRAKEVGMRKVVGARRSQLVKQFLGESFIMAFLALFWAVLLVEVFISPFNALFNKNLVLLDLSASVILLLLAITVVTGFFSGIYPALVLSAYKPVTIIKSGFIKGKGGGKLRRILVLIQFSLTIILFSCTFLIWNQLDFIKNKNLGLVDEQVINLPLYDGAVEKYELLKSELRQYPGVVNVSASNFFPDRDLYNHGLWWEGMSENDNVSMYWMAVDYDFIDTMGIKLLEGRNFSREYATDLSTAYIFNESAVKELGEDVVKGRRFSLFGEGRPGANVIGVVNDFNYYSLRQDVGPLVLCVVPRYFKYLSIRTDTGDMSTLIGKIKNTWSQYMPKRPFEYRFLDESYDALYKAEERMGKLFTFFAILSILVSCLGLYSLASFMASQRTREIGVRKVLGASVGRISLLLSREFTGWIMTANLFAWPVAYLVMKNWLKNFAYQVDITIWPFLISGILALLIAILSVSYQSIKAATQNPVEALKYE